MLDICIQHSISGEVRAIDIVTASMLQAIDNPAI